MSYLALYRRFRPKTFEEVIGQDQIVKTLINQINTDKVGHAYLFCGARGTGKTTLAKVFAKAINCLHPQNGSPCLKCEACLNIDNPANLNVIEMDAASNNKVENVRSIRDNIQFPPVGVKYKVYIIDEVHMLTTEAFNALLKTLEEPPKHAVFILATTEPHKLPATILSRCMRFDFRLVSTKKIASLIKGIYDEIGKKYDEDSITAIAKAGEGSVRDALSIADLCVSVGNEKLTYNDVLQVLGSTDNNKIDLLTKNILKGDVGNVLSNLDELFALGKSVMILSKELLQYIRDLTLIKTCESAKEVLQVPEDIFTSMKETSTLSDEHKLLRVLEIVSEIENNIKYSTQPRVVLETALIKASMPETDYNIDAMLSRIAKLEKEIENLKSNKPNTIESKQVEVKPIITEPKIVSVTKVEEEPKVNVEPKIAVAEKPLQPVEVKEVPSQPTEITANAMRIWGTVIRKLRTMKDKVILLCACQEMTTSLNGDTLVIDTNGEVGQQTILKEENFNIIKEIVSSFGVKNIRIKGENEVNNNEEDIEKVVTFFGEKNVTIE